MIGKYILLSADKGRSAVKDRIWIKEQIEENGPWKISPTCIMWVCKSLKLQVLKGSRHCSPAYPRLNTQFNHGSSSFIYFWQEFGKKCLLLKKNEVHSSSSILPLYKEKKKETQRHSDLPVFNIYQQELDRTWKRLVCLLPVSSMLPVLW